MKRVVRSSAQCLAILLIVSLTALAASKGAISTSKDGRQTIASKPASRTAPSQHFPSGLTMLYNNASNYPLGVYWCCSGYTISGSSSAIGATYADAMPFTPSVNATVTHIGVSVGYVSGDNEVTVSLNSDSDGLPGSSLGSFTASNLPIFGDCCQAVVESVAGIPVTAGTQYWIVVQTTTPSSTTWAAWNENDTNQTLQPFAFYENGSWLSTEGIFGGFGVAGTVQ